MKFNSRRKLYGLSKYAFSFYSVRKDAKKIIKLTYIIYTLTLYDYFGNTLQYENHALGIMKFTSLVEGFLVNITMN